MDRGTGVDGQLVQERNHQVLAQLVHRRSAVALKDLADPILDGHDELRDDSQRQVLIAVAQYPEGVEREQLSVLTGYKRSTRDAYLQRLGTRKLVESVGRGDIRASSELF